jgi:hypothetical protein
MRTDNGLPFAAPTALYRLSKLAAVWWLRLGIRIERIELGKPQQNGRHERMHLTLKREATKPAGENFLQQQARFDAFVTRYNEERPHAALDMHTPASRYAASPRVYRGRTELAYPFHDATITVTHCGRICFRGRKVNLSHALAGRPTDRHKNRHSRRVLSAAFLAPTRPPFAVATMVLKESQLAEETLIQKIRSLPPERVAEIEDFVDFLTVRDQDRHFTQAAARLSEEAFRAVWDNSGDAQYDRL